MSLKMLKDQRLIYWILMILVIYITINPIGLPISITPSTREVYDIIESLPPGSVVLSCSDVELGTIPELMPGYVAMLKHCFRRDLKIVHYSFSSEAAVVTPMIFDALKDDLKDKKYGDDYTIFGFIAGMEIGVASLATDVQATFGADIYGTPVYNIPLMENLKTAADFDLVITAVPASYYRFLMRHWGAAYGMPVLVLPVAQVVPEAMSFVKSGDLAGVLNSIRGSAEYELLLKSPGDAIKALDIQSVSHLYLILLVVLCNVGYYISKRSEKT